MSEVELNNKDVRNIKRIRELYQEIKEIAAGTIVLDDNGDPVEPEYPSGRPAKRTKTTNILAIKQE